VRWLLFVNFRRNFLIDIENQRGVTFPHSVVRVLIKATVVNLNFIIQSLYAGDENTLSEEKVTHIFPCVKEEFTEWLISWVSLTYLIKFHQFSSHVICFGTESTIYLKYLGGSSKPAPKGSHSIHHAKSACALVRALAVRPEWMRQIQLSLSRDRVKQRRLLQSVLPQQRLAQARRKVWNKETRAEQPAPCYWDITACLLALVRLCAPYFFASSV